MSRYTRIATAVALTVMMALSTAAWAGAKGGASVTISWNGDNGAASGTMGTVRNSSDTLQYIGCTVAGNATSKWVSCSARNASNVTVSCTSWEPNIIQAAYAMTSDAHISFSWDASGACTTLSVRADSRYRPKEP
ncbi:hypothetical protein [Vitiosangium sp. GDMCC 1.1324]|uniref:hypothetical protein n=1 Tax=Vitiosangium sp. (strain GDMCC 1.1324) TaxID=2138576 RepID=UPI0011B68F98|nr:hypothetical protein [Vitiosangium sp. GDMCC 1.1324]